MHGGICFCWIRTEAWNLWVLGYVFAFVRAPSFPDTGIDHCAVTSLLKMWADSRGFFGYGDAEVE